MIIVAFEANGIVNTDMFSSDDAKVFSRSGFIEVTVGKEMVAAYNPTKFIVARKISKEEFLRAQTPDPEAANKTVEGENVDPTEAVHPGNGTEGQQSSSDR